MDDFYFDDDLEELGVDPVWQEREEMARNAREERRAEARRRRKRQMRIRAGIAAAAIAAVAGTFLIVRPAAGAGAFLPLAAKQTAGENPGTEADGAASTEGTAEVAVQPTVTAASDAASTEESDAGTAGQTTATGKPLVFQKTADTVTIPVMDDSPASDPSYINSTYAVLINADTGEIVAGRGEGDVISPASMTKILTLLVAVEHLKSGESLNDTFTMTQEISDYTYQAGCSVAGFELGSTVTVEEMLYGTILPSGADAACALAYYTSGSIENFAELMNQKAEELGIADTAHFDNPVGISSEQNKCSITDIAVILQAAMSNELCAKVLSARTFQCKVTNESNPDGILLSNWFLRRIEDKDTGGTVVGAKTGFVNESGSCAASYFTSASGTNYICVTAQAYSSWRAIYDHVAIYKTYAK